LLATVHALRAAEPVDLGDVTERHVMIPMRDGVRLSVPGRFCSSNVTPIYGRSIPAATWLKWPGMGMPWRW
jgi:hypothetical protein